MSYGKNLINFNRFPFLLFTFYFLLFNFLPRKHPAQQVFCIRKTEHVQDLAGLSAPVSAPAIKDYFLVFQRLQLIDLHCFYFAQRNQHTADIKFIVFGYFTHINEV
jgi:hypothetical protein